MKYSVYLEQKFMIKHDLSVNAAALLSLIHNAPAWAENHCKGWFWLSYTSVVSELPAFFKNTRAVTRARKELEEKKLIKQKIVKNKNLFMLTEKGKSWNREVVTKSVPPDKKCTTGGDKKCTTGGDKKCTQSYNYNPNTNDHIRTPLPPRGELSISKNKKPTPISIAKEIAGEGKLLDAFLDFHEMRQKMKSAMTVRAVQLLFNRLDSLAKTEREKIELLEEATMNSWKSVYPKNKKKNDGFVVLENGREVSEITAHNIKIFQQMDEDKKNGKKGIFDGYF